MASLNSSASRIIASWLPISAIPSSAPMRSRGADRKINRAEAVWPAIDKVAEKDDRALLAALRLARGFIDERGQQVRAPVNIADGENLLVRARGEREGEFSTLDGGRHATGPCSNGASPSALHGGAGAR